VCDVQWMKGGFNTRDLYIEATIHSVSVLCLQLLCITQLIQTTFLCVRSQFNFVMETNLDLQFNFASPIFKLPSRPSLTEFTNGSYLF
jgi:hypothetical protein